MRMKWVLLALAVLVSTVVQGSTALERWQERERLKRDTSWVQQQKQELEQQQEQQELEIKEHQWLSDEVRYSLNQIFGGVVILGICTGFIPIMLFALAIWLLKGTWKGSVFIGKKIIEEGSPPKDTPPKLTRMVDEFEKKYSSRD